MRRAARLAIVAALWLVVGAVVNVAVTWGIAAGHQPRGTNAGMEYSRSSAQPAIDVPTGWPPFCVTWGYHTPWMAERAWEDVMPPGERGGLNRTGDHGVNRWSVGWPLLSMCGWIAWERTAPNTFRKSERWQYTVWRSGATPPNIEPTSFPLAPVWPGFGVNAAICGALAWGLWQIPFVVRRWRRRRLGRCVGCGYELRGLAAGAVCPECGRGRAAAL